MYRSTTTLFTAAVTLLLNRAGAAGEIRAGVNPRDVLWALGDFTVIYGDDVEGWEARAPRLIDILMNGLRSRPR